LHPENDSLYPKARVVCQKFDLTGEDPIFFEPINKMGQNNIGQAISTVKIKINYS
jgi:hypothetical protein